jgi:hypothetical protein
MVVAGLLLEVLGLLNGLLAHFVATPAPSFTQGADGEWTATGLDVPTLTEKGNSLMGAVADILVYGATLVDFITQTLVGQSVAGSP